ncbi:hypothetical protein CoNPh17_CDS0223 [Staphylococcus phage S-CoN_Ph17]|nr:hypothetical protein CoNPh17_CDS0223 [Staphylococcus phage S-CoN_Ph17]
MYKIYLHHYHNKPLKQQYYRQFLLSRYLNKLLYRPNQNLLLLFYLVLNRL